MPARSVALAVFVLVFRSSLRFRPRLRSQVPASRPAKASNRRPNSNRIGDKADSFTRDVHRDRQGADASALHELPSRRRKSARRARIVTNICRRCGAKTRPQGAIGTTCSACHHERELRASPKPPLTKAFRGHPRWGLAPLSMAWQGKTIGDICRQVKDVNRNGGRDLQAVAGAHRQGRPRGLGLEPGARPRAGAGQPGGRRQIGPGLDAIPERNARRARLRSIRNSAAALASASRQPCADGGRLPI